MTAPLLLPTEQESVVLRQLTVADAEPYFEAVDANREHLSQFGDVTASKYPNLESVVESIAHPTNEDKLRMGIWDEDTFVGSINLTPEDESAEIGYWLDGRRTGHGYATLATKALANYALSEFPKVHADVTEGNEKSARVLKRAGFKQTAKTAGQLIFELERQPQITAATVADLESITDVMQTTYADTYPNDRGIRRDMFEGNDSFRDHLQEYLVEQLKDPTKKLLVAKQGDEIVGTLGLALKPEAKEGEIWGFYINPSLQGTGLGRRLWAELMSDERIADLDELKLDVAKDSKKAIAFYEKNGFKVVGEEDWDWPHWTDEHPHNQYWLMKKRLH